MLFNVMDAMSISCGDSFCEIILSEKEAYMQIICITRNLAYVWRWHSSIMWSANLMSELGLSIRSYPLYEDNNTDLPDRTVVRAEIESVKH